MLIALLLTSALADTLKTGSKGDEVKAVQQRLIDLGFLDGKADGQFGKKTADAVINFQSWNVLEVTGEVDDNTHERILADNAEAFPKTMGIKTQELINNLSSFRKAITLPGFTYNISDSEKYSRAINVTIDNYNAIVITQCAEQVVEFIVIGIGDGSTESGYDMLLTFSGALAASNKNINNNECADYILRLIDGETLSIGGITDKYTKNDYTGNLLTATVD